MNNRYKLSHLSNAQVIEGTHGVTKESRESTALLLAHFGEMERRGLHLRKAKGSMFQYAVDVLGFSEAAAYMRIHAARAARKYQVILEMVARGALHLTAVRLVSVHLTKDNHRELLEAVSHKSKRQVQAELARRYPQPDAPQVLRKLPERKSPVVIEQSPSACVSAQSAQDALGVLGSLDPVPTQPAPLPMLQPAPAALNQNTQSTPLSKSRFKLQLTISAETQAKLEQAQQLLRHRVPSGDLAEVLDAALDTLLKNELKRQFGVTDKPRKKCEDNPAGGRSGVRTRHIPNEVKRQVLERDGLRCAFVSSDGDRCTETGFLQLHHVDAFGKGGAHSADNIHVYCRGHNMLAAEQDYGPEHMSQYGTGGVSPLGTVKEYGRVYSSAGLLCPDTYAANTRRSQLGEGGP